MTGTFGAAILVGLTGGAGLCLILVAALGRNAPPAAHVRRNRMTTVVHRWRLDGRRTMAAGLTAVAVGVYTGWPVAALLAAAATYVVPKLIAPDREHQRAQDRVEAVAVFTESLRDTLSAAAGLEQSVRAAASAPPEAISGEVRLLAARIQRGHRLPDALRLFAADVDDAIGDLVVTALVMAAERNARNIGELLTSLAAAARDQAALRMRVAAGRARVKTTIRVVVTVTIGMAALLLLFNRQYLAPYDSITGQVVLLAAGGLFTAGFWWLDKIAKVAEPPRVLTQGARP